MAVKSGDALFRAGVDFGFNVRLAEFENSKPYVE
jgi:hypothetical protein